jgi:hypothetical protein
MGAVDLVAFVEGSQITWMLFMRRDSQRSVEPLKITIPGHHSYHILLTELKPGRWRARREGSAEMHDVTVH